MIDTSVLILLTIGLVCTGVVASTLIHESTTIANETVNIREEVLTPFYLQINETLEQIKYVGGDTNE